ncbi:MAG: Rab family GTPase [Candidatus Hodarchaeota archaeon]
MSKFTFVSDSSIVIKVVLLGDGAVGKTTLKNRYTGKGFQERYMPTLGADITIVPMKVQDEVYKVHFWDLAGQPKFHKVRELYYNGSVAAILVYDITQAKSLPNLRMWIQTLERKSPSSKKAPLIVVGNKIDLRGTSEGEITHSQGLNFVKSLKKEFGASRPIYFFETSAKTKENVTKVFEKLTEELIRMKEETK